MHKNAINTLGVLKKVNKGFILCVNYECEVELCTILYDYGLETTKIYLDTDPVTQYATVEFVTFKTLKIATVVIILNDNIYIGFGSSTFDSLYNQFVSSFSDFLSLFVGEKLRSLCWDRSNCTINNRWRAATWCPWIAGACSTWILLLSMWWY